METEDTHSHPRCSQDMGEPTLCHSTASQESGDQCPPLRPQTAPLWWGKCVASELGRGFYQRDLLPTVHPVQGAPARSQPTCLVEANRKGDQRGGKNRAATGVRQGTESPIHKGTGPRRELGGGGKGRGGGAGRGGSRTGESKGSGNRARTHVDETSHTTSNETQRGHMQRQCEGGAREGAWLLQGPSSLHPELSAGSTVRA